MNPVVNYSQCWEDAELLLDVLKINSQDRVLSITSGGDNSLSLLSQSPQALVMLDCDRGQNAITELKMIALRHLSYKEYLEILGVMPANNAQEYYDIVAPHLSQGAQEWFSQNREVFSCGVIHSGKFEHYLNFFRKHLLPYVHNKKTISLFFEQGNLKTQKLFYVNTWCSWRWRSFFWIATQARLLRRFARQRRMYSGERKNTSVNYSKRIDRLVGNVLVRDSSYTAYCLLGRYTDKLPHYAREHVFNKMRNNTTTSVAQENQDILSYLQEVPDDSFTKYNLSDIFEGFLEEDSSQLWQEIVRVSVNGAVVVYWCNQVDHTPPLTLENRVVFQKEMSEKKSMEDRTFFYQNIKIYQINK